MKIENKAQIEAEKERTKRHNFRSTPLMEKVLEKWMVEHGSSNITEAISGIFSEYDQMVSVESTLGVKNTPTVAELERALAHQQELTHILRIEAACKAEALAFLEGLYHDRVICKVTLVNVARKLCEGCQANPRIYLNCPLKNPREVK